MPSVVTVAPDIVVAEPDPWIWYAGVYGCVHGSPAWVTKDAT